METRFVDSKEIARMYGQDVRAIGGWLGSLKRWGRLAFDHCDNETGARMYKLEDVEQYALASGFVLADDGSVTEDETDDHIDTKLLKERLYNLQQAIERNRKNLEFIAALVDTIMEENDLYDL